MTRTTAAVLAFACLLFMPAAASAQNITGAWEVSMATPTGPTTVDVTFKQDGEALAGELTSPLGTAPFKGTLVKDALTVVATLDVQGNPLQLTFNAKVTNDSLTGTVKFGDLGEAPFTGKRKAATAAATTTASTTASTTTAGSTGSTASTTTSGVTGKWDIVMNLQGNEMPLSAAFTQDGDKVAGTLTSDQGDLIVKGTMAGNVLKLDFVAPTPNGDLAITMTGNLTGGALIGTMNIAGLGDADWTGKRSK